MIINFSICRLYKRGRREEKRRGEENGRLTIFPLRFHLTERYPLHDKILHPHSCSIWFTHFRSDARESIDHLFARETNLSSIRLLFESSSIFFLFFVSTRYPRFRSKTLWIVSCGGIRKRTIVERPFVSSLNFVRSFVRYRSKERRDRSENWKIAVMKIGATGRRRSGCRSIACRSRLNADFSCIRATICFAAATVCVWLWTLGYSQPGLRLLVKRWMERGNVPLLLLFFARRHGV